MSEPITDREIATAMLQFGGSFISALGSAWMRADPMNGDRIAKAFPDFWEEYRELVQLHRNRAKASA